MAAAERYRPVPLLPAGRRRATDGPIDAVDSRDGQTRRPPIIADDTVLVST
jgi:hypothetical protein